MHLVISKLTIADPSVMLRPGVPGLAQEVVIPLSTITMENVGSGPDAQNGAAIQDVIMAIITRMADQAANSDKLSEQLKGLLKLDTKQMAAAIGGAVGTEMTKIEKGLEQQLAAPATQVIGDVLKQTTGQPDAGKAVQKGLEDLLGGGKDRKKDRAPTTRP